MIRDCCAQCATKSGKGRLGDASIADFQPGGALYSTSESTVYGDAPGPTIADYQPGGALYVPSESNIYQPPPAPDKKPVDWTTVALIAALSFAGLAVLQSGGRR